MGQFDCFSAGVSYPGAVDNPVDNPGGSVDKSGLVIHRLWISCG